MGCPVNAPGELLAELWRRGIELRADGDRLCYRPVSAVPPDLRSQLAQHKPELLAILARGMATGPSTFRFVDGMMDFGDVCAGWTPAAWAAELRRKAGCCDEYRPDVASYYRAWATDIEKRLPATGEIPEIGLA